MIVGGLGGVFDYKSVSEC